MTGDVIRDLAFREGELNALIGLMFAKGATLEFRQAAKDSFGPAIEVRVANRSVLLSRVGDGNINFLIRALCEAAT